MTRIVIYPMNELRNEFDNSPFTFNKIKYSDINIEFPTYIFDYETDIDAIKMFCQIQRSFDGYCVTILESINCKKSIIFRMNGIYYVAIMLASGETQLKRKEEDTICWFDTFEIYHENKPTDDIA